MIQLTSSDKMKIHEFLLQGLSEQDIADAFGLDVAIVVEMKEQMVEMQRQATAHDALVVELYSPPSKLAVIDIEEMLGISAPTIYRILRRMKVPLRHSYERRSKVPILKYIDGLEKALERWHPGGVVEVRKETGWG